MMRPRALKCFLALTKLAPVVLAISTAAAATNEGITEAEAWAANHATEAIAKVFDPIFYAPGTLPQEIAWHFSVVVFPSQGPAIRLSLRAEYGGRVVVAVRRGPESGLMDAITRLHIVHPAASPIELAALIPLDDVEISSNECPDLKPVARELQHLRLPTKAPLVVSFHGTGYDFVTQDYGGFVLRGYVTGAVPLGVRKRQPIAQWTDKLRQVVRACGVH